MLYGNSDAFCAIMNYLKDNVEPDYIVSEIAKGYSIEQKLIRTIMNQVNSFNDGYLKAYIVDGGVTIDQEAGHMWDDELESIIIGVKTGLGEMPKDETAATETETPINSEDELQQQEPNPSERPKFDRGKAMDKLDD